MMYSNIMSMKKLIKTKLNNVTDYMHAIIVKSGLSNTW